ncbi:TRAP transporter substrate-binding protein [Acidimangrovimonas pyrenivorans]|uniref:TRAP transporter substrate-binding protein n=1 Tax=Acidimangrovimonas pyrenivorans TaxID=2030798 RepID=A0ABV7AE02_9RHOB
MKFLTAAAAAALLCLSAVPSLAQSSACDPGETVIKFSFVTNATKHPKGIAAQLFADRVNKEMNGKVCVELYPNSTLYNDDQVLEAMLQGDVQMAAPSLSKFEAFTKKFRIFDLPFMFKNIAAVDEFQNSAAGQKMKGSMERRGLKGLEFWHSGMKQFSANKPLLLPSDAKGLKFRVQPSDVLVAMIQAIGGSPQPMAFSEVYGALQTGVVDGQENTWSNIYGKKFYEVQDGITETNHGVLDYLVVTSSDFWDGLPDDVRAELTKILHQVTVERNAAVTEVEAKNRQNILDAGATIRELTPVQRQAWVDAMKPVWSKFVKDVGQDNIDAAQAINAKH